MSQPAYARLEPPSQPAREPAQRPRPAPTAHGRPAVLAAHAMPRRRPRRRSRGLPALACLVAVSAAAWAVVVRPQGESAVVRAVADPPPVEAAAAPPRPEPASGLAPAYAWMLDPAPALGAAVTAWDAPLAPRFRQAVVQVAAAPEPEAPPSAQAPAPTPAAVSPASAAAVPSPPAPPAAAVRIAAAEPAPVSVPLPVPRPVELRRPLAAPAPRLAGRALPRTRDVFRAAMAEEPSFFDKLFGTGRAEAPRQALAYASPDAFPRESPRARISPAPEAGATAGTAVYDISARRVTLPSGEVLEAHSGLGPAMDDPRYVHLRMRGSTPPGTYDLTERERLFHGVRAIRLNPVGGSAAIHGRDGLLAHTYMLRQPGASNGCVSFRDYDRFLQAFLRGEVRRLVVVAGDRGDFFGTRRIGLLDRPGRRS